jgi:hypothetical protein
LEEQRRQRRHKGKREPRVLLWFNFEEKGKGKGKEMLTLSSYLFTCWRTTEDSSLGQQVKAGLVLAW